MNGLRQRRLDRGLTQREVAKRVGCAQPYLCNVEHDKAKLTDDMRQKIIDALNDPTEPEPIRRKVKDFPVLTKMTEDEKVQLHEIWCNKYSGIREQHRGLRQEL